MIMGKQYPRINIDSFMHHIFWGAAGSNYGGGAEPLPGPGAHRYWRLIETHEDCRWAIGEMELRATVGGADETGSGTSNASSEYSGSYPHIWAFNNGGTVLHWASASAGPYPSWISYDFGAGNDVEILEVNIQSDNGDYTMAPKNFHFQYSDNNTDWTTYFTVVGEPTWTANESRVFVNVARSGYRYWRLYCDNAQTRIGIGELQLRSEIDGDNLAVSSALVDGSSEYSATYSPSKAVDSNISTHWTTPTSSDPQWISYDFLIERDIVEVAIQAGANDSSLTIQDFDLQYSSDNVTWETSFSAMGATGWSAQELRTFVTPPPEHRYWRLICTSSQSLAGAAELEFRASIGGADETGSGTAIASGYNNSGSQPVEAFNNVNSDGWIGTGGNGNWIGYDFGDGNDVEIVEVQIKTGPSYQYAMTGFDLEWSDDGTNWARTFGVLHCYAPVYLAGNSIKYPTVFHARF
jgi:hypothetical protein